MDRSIDNLSQTNFSIEAENAELRRGVSALKAALDELKRQVSDSILPVDAESFRALAEQGEAMITRYDMDGTFLYASPSRTQITGYELEEIVGQSAYDFMHPDDIEMVSRDIHPRLRNGESVRYQWRAKIKGGGYRWMESSTQVLFDEKQNPLQIHCTSIDIHRQKEVELSLQQSEARWRAMVEGSPDYVRVVDKNLRLIYANRVMPGQSWTPDQYVDYRDWVPKESRELVANAVADAIATQSTIVLDDLNYGTSVEEYWLRIRFSPILRDGESHVLIIVTDITALKQGQAAVRESEEKYRLLFERGPEPAWVIEQDSWAFLAVNPASVKHYGYSEQEFLSMTALDVRCPEDIEGFVSRMKRYRGRKEGRNRFIRHRKKDGSVIFVDALWHEIEFQGRRAYLVLCRDMTDEKEAEERIQATNLELDRRVSERTAQLEATNQELESFTYSVSHDLRSPLRSIDGYSTMLLTDHGYLLNDEAKDYLERIRVAGRRMSDLINNLLGLSRLTRTPLKPEKLSLTYLAQSILDDLRSRNPDFTGDVYVHPEMWVVADPQLVQIAMTNLIENAVKFSSKRSNSMIEVGVVDEHGDRKFYVKDNGAGFDMAYSDKLFGAFQRLHSDREFEGTGIGLATVQRIIQRHGGRIWAEAAVDKGATFWFSLPDMPEG
ncbi:MAG: PAS domain S-box protein [Fimbriimonadaceae bacterium]|nr:PAS domain S-box protein [Fimbriimonadaceae bacterium]